MIGIVPSPDVRNELARPGLILRVCAQMRGLRGSAPSPPKPPKAGLRPSAPERFRRYRRPASSAERHPTGIGEPVFDLSRLARLALDQAESMIRATISWSNVGGPPRRLLRKSRSSSVSSTLELRLRSPESISKQTEIGLRWEGRGRLFTTSVSRGCEIATRDAGFRSGGAALRSRLPVRGRSTQRFEKRRPGVPRTPGPRNRNST
jgi:hypothetical protein